MNKVIILVCLLACPWKSMASGAIYDETCEISIPKARTTIGWFTWTIEQSSLNTLIQKGYSPYRVDDNSEVSKGLALKWGFKIEEHWYGDSTTYKASIMKIDVTKDLYLGVSESNYSLDNALKELPNCLRKN